MTYKIYHFQDYEYKDKMQRIPDYRHQLFWDPDIVLKNNRTSLFFYTSDNTGVYEITLEGFTEKGVPVSLSKVIQVE